MIRITQTLTGADYRAAAAVHYATYRSSKYRPWLAALLICIGVFLVATSTQTAFGAFGIAYGIFMLFRKRLWVRRMVNSAATAKRFGDEIRVEVDPDGRISSEQGEDRSDLHMDSLVGFIRHPIGILLYPQRNMFYYLQARAFESSEQMDVLHDLLKGHGVSELKA